MDRPNGNVGVELGVASGSFSRQLAETGRFRHLFGIDAYADHHDVAEYKEALCSVGLFNDYTLLRMTFEEALDLFEDNSLDFLYIDGYAHTGEEGGETIYAWSAKVRCGGCVSGHDYDSRFPLVVESVDRFVADGGFELHITNEPDCAHSYPSWAVIKTAAVPRHAPRDLYRRGRSAAIRFKVRNAVARPLKRLLRNRSKRRS